MEMSIKKREYLYIIILVELCLVKHLCGRLSQAEKKTLRLREQMSPDQLVRHLIAWKFLSM
jgi:hypothetical protein